MQRPDSKAKSGFTLIELSIVLVIIGLIVGGILTGRDLIDAASQRAQITQIERYQTAVRTFQGKYGYLPGDISDPYASNFGFIARGQYQGEGDGNGVLEGNCANNSAGAGSFEEGCGEIAVFWVDLSTANLIDTNVAALGVGYPHTNGQSGAGVNLTSTPHSIYQWLPTAKIGSTNFIYIDSINGVNYFILSSVDNIGWTLQSSSNPGITVQQAYNIDKKIDDGLPQSGGVTACYVNNNVVGYQSIYAAGGLQQGASGGSTTINSTGNFNNCNPTTAATPYATTNCFDNNNVAGTQKYSLSQNANLQNCALSFKFQ